MMASGGEGGKGGKHQILDSSNGEETWTTIGVSENIIEASWQALVDSIVYGLLRARAEQN